MEIWVKKVVSEKYLEKVPIKRVRQVRVAHKEVQEVEELEEIDVPTTKAINVPSFRIDEVQDSKVVEVEEMEDMQWHANPTGDHMLVKTEEGPIIPGPHHTRKVGGEFYNRTDPHIQHLPVDSDRSATFAHERTHRASRSQPQYEQHPDMRNHPGRRPYGNMPPTLNGSQPMRPLEEPRTTNGGYGWKTSYAHQNNWTAPNAPGEDPRFRAGEYSAQRYPGMDRGQQMQQAGGNRSKGLGMTVKSTATAHTDSHGVVVTRVNGQSFAARAGLRQNDVIVECQGRKTTSIQELGTAIESASGGALRMVVNRDGRRVQEVVVYRD